jgi:protease IV
MSSESTPSPEERQQPGATPAQQPAQQPARPPVQAPRAAGPPPPPPPRGPYPPGPPPGRPAPRQEVVLVKESIGRSMLRAGAVTTAVLVVAGILSFVATLPVFGLFALSAAGGLTAAESSKLPTDFAGGEEDATNRILAIPIQGAIMGEPDGAAALGGATYGYEVRDQLMEAAEDDSIDGVVLEMNTPGGTIYGAKAIADAVQEYQKRTGKKVVAYVGGISASGGMYAMAGADRIVADHGTLIGSIGVIFGPLEFYDQVVAIDGGLLGGGVTTRGGITQEYVTAGRGKDAGNPFRKLTPEEKAVIQKGVTNAYGEFTEWVATARGIPREKIVNEIAAHAYDEQTARTLGLVDEIGNRDAAWRQAAELNGISEGDYRVDRLKTGSSLLSLLGVERQGEAPKAQAPAQGASPLCGLQPAVLAYSGNLTKLCTKG